MAHELLKLQPAPVWKHFLELTKIPRPSGHEKQVIEHIRQLADKMGLASQTDATGNLIIRKEASQGRKDAPGIILQAHVDMVPQKNSDKIHNFLTDPIEPIIDGEWVRANQTTLGADNGIGVASILSLLEDNSINHGPLEALFTVSEETGMDGAFGLNGKELKGKALLNLDSEDEGEIFIGCAGGIDINCSWKYETVTAEGTHIKISLSGLKGGHSGIDINLGRGNANKIMTDILEKISDIIPFNLIGFSGGNLRNAIPREAEAVIVTASENVQKLSAKIESLLQGLKKQFEGIENNISLKSETIDQSGKSMTVDEFKRFINLMKQCPNGVITMSVNLEGIVQTSNNISIVRVAEGKAEVKTLLRSSDNDEKQENADRIKKIFSPGVTYEATNGYPGWLPDPASKVLGLAKAVYKNKFGKEPEVKVIHAGLECGIIGDKVPGLDMISFGPTIRHPHSPDEKVHIASVNKFWVFLKALVEEYK